MSDCEELVRSIKIELHSTKLAQKFSLVRACSGFFLRSPIALMNEYRRVARSTTSNAHGHWIQ